MPRSRRLDPKTLGTVERDAAGSGCCRPPRRLTHTAKRKEVRRNIAEPSAGFRKLPDNSVGRAIAYEMLEQAALARKSLSGSNYAAALGVAQQRREIGRSRHADADLIFDPEIAQLENPGCDLLRRKTKLGDDMNIEPGLSRGFDLRRKRAVEHFGGNPRMAVRVSGNADLHDPVAL